MDKGMGVYAHHARTRPSDAESYWRRCWRRVRRSLASCADAALALVYFTATVWCMETPVGFVSVSKGAGVGTAVRPVLQCAQHKRLRTVWRKAAAAAPWFVVAPVRRLSERHGTRWSHASTLHMREGEPVVVLCPGQGAQTVGQGRAWYEASSAAREIIQRADRYLGRSRLPNGQSLMDIMFNGPKHVLDRTDVAQPAIFVTSLACWYGLQQFELAPGTRREPSYVAATAGLSLGEYTALTLAGAFEFEAGLELVTIRGDAMQKAAEDSEGTMVAILGISEEQAMDLCEACRKRNEVLVPANFNAPGQIVLSGSKDACRRAMEYATATLHLKATELSVAGAFHSQLMQPAADRLADALQTIDVNLPLQYPVMCNVTGRPHENQKDAIKQRLVEQLTAPVRWQACIQTAIMDHGDRTNFLELAPGRTLAGLLKRIDRKRAISNYDAPVTQAMS
jgi:[acyl-carrier-protein] S-malonyltransferase